MLPSGSSALAVKCTAKTGSLPRVDEASMLSKGSRFIPLKIKARASIKLVYQKKYFA